MSNDNSPVKLYEEAEANAIEFAKIMHPKYAHKQYHAFTKSLGITRHWYYFTGVGFAPGKFAGLRDAKIETFEGQINGGDARNALEKWFRILIHESDEFNRLFNELRYFLSPSGKAPSSDVYTLNRGGIHVRKVDS